MADAPYHAVIKELPENERPRERLALYGESALSNAELIAIALRVGSRQENAVALAQRLLAAFDGLGGLARANISEVCQVPGIKAALELGRRLILSSEDGRPQIRRPDDAANLFIAAMCTELQEQMRVMALDTKHRVLRTHLVYVGNVNTAVIRTAEVFREAIKENAVAIIVAHNHPSGDPTPSPEDVQITEEIVRAGNLLGIQVLDHLIIGRQQYLSLKERGLGFH
jgi:DNA repair protein RadC